MKCPKCGYHSFEHLDDCKKCGQSLADHKAKFNLRGFCASGQAAVSAPAAAIDAAPDAPEPADDGSVDFGFDFLDEEEDQVEAADRASLDSDDQDINIIARKIEKNFNQAQGDQIECEDGGFYLLPIILLLILMFFRQGLWAQVWRFS